MASFTENIVFFILSIFLLLEKGFSDKVAGKIYTELKHVAPCVRLTNATHEIGCSSSMGGHVGIVHLIQSQQDIDWLIQHGDHSPYIPLFTSTMFNDKTMKVLVDKQLINGAMVIFAGKDGQAPTDGFSPDQDCPSDRYGMYSGDSKYGSCKKVKWNEKGNGMSFISYGIPVFALYNENEVNDLIKCFNENNKPVNGSKPDFPLCGVELKDFMFAAKDTPTCMRKTQIPNPTQNQFCEPLGDYNVWGTLYPITEKPKKGDIVVAAAKLDSSSFFHDMVHGAENDASGVIALLAAAYALGEMKRNGTMSPPAKPIMFTLFQGESWDYIGSSRMVYDMDNNHFPPNSWKVNGSKEDLTLNTSDIGYFLELNQVGLGTGPLWAHSDPISRNKTEVNSKVDKMFQILQNSSKLASVPVENPSPSNDQPLPPASFQRFLMSNKEIPGIVLTDHKAEFQNKYYNSRFDNAFYVKGNFTKVENSSKIYLSNAFTQRLTKVATTVANTLYTLANDGNPPKQPLKANKTLIGHLVYCSFYRTKCDLFKSVFSTSLGAKLPESPLSRYVSVNSANNTLTIITHHLLLYLTGNYLPPSADCHSDKPHVTMKMHGHTNYTEDICVNGTVYYSVAESPAFLLHQYDSTQYSTWAESTWPNDLSVRMFLVSSPQSQVVTLASGIIITLFSFALVVFIHRKAELLFTPVDIPSNPDADS